MSSNQRASDRKDALSAVARAKIARSPLADSPPTPLTQVHARLLLPALIGRLSLDCYDRGWIISLPFTLWEAVIGEPTEPFGDEDVALFRHLSDVAGGWAHHDEKEGPRFVARALWAEEFSKWKASQPSREAEMTKTWDRARRRMRRLAAKKRRMTPDELVVLARALAETTDPRTAAELRLELMQGWYGKPDRESLVRGGLIGHDVESHERLAAIDAGDRSLDTNGPRITSREELEATVRRAAGVAMTVTIQNGQMAWFEKLLATLTPTQPIAFQGLENDRWTFAFTVPDEKSARAIVAKLKRSGVRQFKIL